MQSRDYVYTLSTSLVCQCTQAWHGALGAKRADVKTAVSIPRGEPRYITESSPARGLITRAHPAGPSRRESRRRARSWRGTTRGGRDGNHPHQVKARPIGQSPGEGIQFAGPGPVRSRTCGPGRRDSPEAAADTAVSGTTVTMESGTKCQPVILEELQVFA